MISNGGCYRAIDSLAAQVAAERHSRKLSRPLILRQPRCRVNLVGIMRGVVLVTAGPGDQGAADAAAHGRLRASHGDRERVIGVLQVAFVQGRLTKAELDARVGQTFASRTYGELAALTADLPAGLITAPLPGQPSWSRTRPAMGKVVARAALIVPPPTMVVAAFLTGSEQVARWAALVVVLFVMAWMVAGAAMLDSWYQRRSRGHLPPRPKRGGLALEGEQDGGPGSDLIPCQAHGETRTRRLPGRSVTQRIRRSVPTRRVGAGLCA